MSKKDQHSESLLDIAIRERPTNGEGKDRRIGIEIEFAGVDAQTIIDLMNKELHGEEVWKSPFEIDIETENLGTFKLELDSKQIKELGENSKVIGNPSDAQPGLDRTYIETVAKVAENLVPWEIVSPPLTLKQTKRLFPLVSQLREAGALGTRAAVRYAFGVHLNPEPINLKAETITRHLKSFFCLYDWILRAGEIDVARRITPYINHFKKDYVVKVLSASYEPTIDELIDDYLEANATRNRSLDMLPMFAHLDQDKVSRAVQDDRVKARPTFHYRLPNCEIDDPRWNLNRPLEIWMAVEELALDDSLQDVCDEYREKLTGLLPVIGSSWADRVAELVSLPQPDSWAPSV